MAHAWPRWAGLAPGAQRSGPGPFPGSGPGAPLATGALGLGSLGLGSFVWRHEFEIIAKEAHLGLVGLVTSLVSCGTFV